MAESILEVRNLTKSFVGVTAINGVTMDIEEGSIVGIIGPNGAGKTTLLNLISGFYEPDDGKIVFANKEVTDLSPHERANRGLVRTFQITKQFSGMTVMDNMLVAYPNQDEHKVIPQTLAGKSVSEEKMKEIKYWLEELELWEVRDEYAGNISGGQQKLLELGRTLLMDPDLLLFDEPMAGINPALSDDLLELIQRLKDEHGLTFGIIEHDMDVIMSISDTILALNKGEILVYGEPEQVQQDEALLDSYIGGE